MWSNHPITKKFIEILIEIYTANKEDVIQTILNSSAEDIKNKQGRLIQLKGQIHVIERLLDLKTFLIEEIQEEYEIQSGGAKSFSED